jgi:hypothetical protein
MKVGDEMRKLREAAIMVAVVGSVGMIGAGTAVAHGGAPDVSIKCSQDTGDNTITKREVVGGLLGLNISDALNGGDAKSTSNQQVCGLENEDIESEADDATGGDGLNLL